MKTNRFLLAAGISLAMAFTFSCDSGGGGDGTGGGSSSSGGPGPGGNSSSGGGGYTVCSGGGSGSTCTNFKTKKIGEQTWMAENLNCDVGVGVSKCYGDDPACCAKYGRLYDWSTALTACPSGWHLPSGAEWDALMTAVGGSGTAGTKLKATSGWNDDNGASGNGTDDYGFSALPGGYGSLGVGYRGFWWSAREWEHDSDYAYYRGMDYNLSNVASTFNSKSYLFSVRCLQD